MQNTRHSCQILMKLEFSRKILEKYSNIKFNENPSSGSGVAPRGKNGQTDMTKLIVAFRNFTKAPKIIISRTEVQWDKTTCNQLQRHDFSWR